MKRTAELKRRPVRPSLQPIPRYTELKRSTKPIPKRRKDPSKRAWAKHRDWDYWAWIKTLGCLICGRQPADPAHVIKRSRGSDDRKNLVPLCRWHHDQQEGHTAEFEWKHGVNLTEVAKLYDAQYEKGER